MTEIVPQKTGLGGGGRLYSLKTLLYFVIDLCAYLCASPGNLLSILCSQYLDCHPGDCVIDLYISFYLWNEYD